MSLAPSHIRARIAAAIDSQLGPRTGRTPAWYESRYAYPTFPGPDSRDIVTRAYAVGVVSSRMHAQDRQRAVRGVHAETVVGVRYCRNLQLDAHVAAYDSALDDELVLVEAVHSVLRAPGLILRLDEVLARVVTEDGAIYLGEIRWLVTHLYPLDGPPLTAP